MDNIQISIFSILFDIDIQRKFVKYDEEKYFVFMGTAKQRLVNTSYKLPPVQGCCNLWLVPIFIVDINIRRWSFYS